MVVKCPECGGDVRKAGSESVCVSCGFILEDSPLVGDIDRRDIEYYQRQLSRPSGCMPVAVKDKKVVEMYKALYPLVSAEEQRQHHLEIELSRIGSLLSLCRFDRTRVLYFYNDLRKKGLTKNYPLDAVLGAVAGVVMVMDGKVRVAPTQLAEVIGAPKKTLRRLYYLYSKELLPHYLYLRTRFPRTGESRFDREIQRIKEKYTEREN